MSPTSPTDGNGADGRHHYGGEHHALSVIDRLGARLDRDLAAAYDDLDQRDPSFIESTMPALRRALRYFDPEVRDFDRLPASGPVLVVANHSGGVFMPDYYAFLQKWVEERGAEAPLYSLGFDFMFAIPYLGRRARRMGAVPANPRLAGELLDRGATVLTYPGGDEDDYRPWTERHRVDLRGRTGFVKLALRHGVPVVPMVSHGSHDALVVVARGDEIARRLGLGRLRINVFPIVIGPAGPMPLPVIVPPMPAKVVTRLCEPFDWSELGPEAADDPTIVRHCYEEVLGRMQATLDELVAELPHPVLNRLRTALGLDRLRR